MICPQAGALPDAHPSLELPAVQQSSGAYRCAMPASISYASVSDDTQYHLPLEASNDPSPTSPTIEMVQIDPSDVLGPEESECQVQSALLTSTIEESSGQESEEKGNKAQFIAPTTLMTILSDLCVVLCPLALIGFTLAILAKDGHPKDEAYAKIQSTIIIASPHLAL